MGETSKTGQCSTTATSVPGDWSVHEILKLLTRRVKGKAVFFTDRNAVYPKIMERYSVNMEIQDIRNIYREKENLFRSVILMEVLENFSDSEAVKILENAWSFLEERGYLFVVVPNGNVYSHNYQVRSIKRKGLKKLLRLFGRPKIMKEQPFQWLIMYVKKRSGEERGLNRSKLNRIRTTVGLCKGKVLELGCGEGHLTEEVRNQGFEITGVDMNVEKIERAQYRCPDISFIQSDVLKLSLPPGSFDTVILPELLEHVPEETGNKMLDTAWRLLKIQGRLIVSVPNENCIPHPNHVCQFDMHSLKSLLSRYGKPYTSLDQPYKWLMMYVDKNEGQSKEYHPSRQNFLQEDHSLSG
jgi:2-polyprenyl-3-methyl-5-hydroxy-6-metoxy-1,4-benzoquinol methylase